MDTKGAIQICSVGIERMLGITTAEVMVQPRWAQLGRGWNFAIPQKRLHAPPR